MKNFEIELSLDAELQSKYELHMRYKACSA